MNFNNFGDPVTFYLSSSQNFNFPNTTKYVQNKGFWLMLISKDIKTKMMSIINSYHYVNIIIVSM